jgi:hypothetical protein
MSVAEWKIEQAAREARLERIKDELLLWGSIGSFGFFLAGEYLWFSLIYAIPVVVLAVLVAYAVVRLRLIKLRGY